MDVLEVEPGSPQRHQHFFEHVDLLRGEVEVFVRHRKVRVDALDFQMLEAEHRAEEGHGVHRQHAQPPHARIDLDVNAQLLADFARHVVVGARQVDVVDGDGDVLANRLPDRLAGV